MTYFSSYLQLYGTAGATYVRRRKTEEYHPKCVVPTIKHGGGSIMVWGCMGANGVGEIVVCEGHMNTEKYIEVLQSCLEASAIKIFEEDEPDYYFQQDSAPCHVSKRAKNYFSEQNIRLLEWPSQSPDLNPIEHLWFELKKAVKKHNIKNKNHLIQTVLEEWKKISPAVCANLVHSMPRRVAAVIANRGGPTKY